MAKTIVIIPESDKLRFDELNKNSTGQFIVQLNKTRDGYIATLSGLGGREDELSSEL